MASVSIFHITVTGLRKPQHSARTLGPSFIDSWQRSEIQIVSVHPQNTQDSAGFAQIAAYDSLKIRNSATPPVVYGFRGKQIHPDEQFHWSNESPFLKEILSRFHNSGVVPIPPVICECDFLQLSVLPKLYPTANGCPISDILIRIGRELRWWLFPEPVSISENHDGSMSRSKAAERARLVVLVSVVDPFSKIKRRKSNARASSCRNK